MPSGRNKIATMLKGAMIGFLAVVVLLLVPIVGVRKGKDLVHNWQELVLYITCLASGAVAGARLTPNRGSIYENDDEDSTQADSTPAISEWRPEPTLVSYEDAVEVSLAGEPKKRRLGPFIYYFHHDKERTLALLGCLYLVLYVNCAVLCQKMRLGIISAGESGDSIIRSVGVCITLVGLYLCLRGVQRRGAPPKLLVAAPLATAEPVPSEGAVESEAVVVLSTETLAAGEMSDVLSTQKKRFEKSDLDPQRPSPFKLVGSRRVYKAVVSHIPPTRFAFITRNFICLGSLLVLTGLPLVFHAWFPLVALPGIFIVMSWMFSGENEKQGSLVVQSQS